MRFPLSLTTTMVGYMARKKLARQNRFPLVLMLEPLHACNLTCTGCGRIREYKQTIKEKLTVAECLASVDEAGAPIVSICGGEPMIYPEIGPLVRGILKRRKHIYLCTNGMFIRKRLHEFKPTSRFFFNVHLDGLEETHDRAVERKLTCTAWGNPTRNVKGWKGPCYLITDQHHDSFESLMNDTDWDAYGRGKDPRCEHCMVHCGFEPSAALGVNRRLGDSLKMLLWQLTSCCRALECGGLGRFGLFFPPLAR